MKRGVRYTQIACWEINLEDGVPEVPQPLTGSEFSNKSSLTHFTNQIINA
jgi:hypothetical protein